MDTNKNFLNMIQILNEASNLSYLLNNAGRIFTLDHFVDYYVKVKKERVAILWNACMDFEITFLETLKESLLDKHKNCLPYLIVRLKSILNIEQFLSFYNYCQSQFLKNTEIDIDDPSVQFVIELFEIVNNTIFRLEVEEHDIEKCKEQFKKIC